MSRLRTTVEVDDTDVRRIMERYGVSSEAQAVELAVRIAAGESPMMADEILAMHAAIGEIPLDLSPMSDEEMLAMEGAHAIGELPPDRGPRGDAWSYPTPRLGLNTIAQPEAQSIFVYVS